jgi:Holliday junction resolvase RusA-like endonuclease
VSVIEITLELDPVPWAAPRLGRYQHAYDPKEKDKRAARYLIKQQYKGEPISETVILSFLFVFPVPKSASKSRKEKMLAGEIIPTRCDCTNLQKLYEDCLKGIVITDDRNVVYVSSYKIYGEKGKVIIIIYKLNS